MKNLLIILLIFSFSSQAYAANVMDLRTYTDSEKTRITVQLDKKIQYKTRYDTEHNIRLYLLETDITLPNKTRDINNDLIGSINLEPIENMVVIIIELKKPVSFVVFPLNSPERIVIDVMPIAPEISGTISDYPSSINIGKEYKSDLTENKKYAKSEVKLSRSSMGNINLKLIQFGFDSVLIASLIFMGVCFYRSKKHAPATSSLGLEDMPEVEKPKPVKKVRNGKTFANMMNELDSVKPISDESNYDNRQSAKEKSKRESLPLPKEYEKVFELDQRGLDRLTISQKSNIPIGEVNLILDLLKPHKDKTTTTK